MSGAEAGFIVGLISGLISIIEKTKTLYDAAKDAKGQPDAFRQVAARLPLVARILRKTEERILALNEVEQEAQEDFFKSLKRKAERLEEIFSKVIRKDDDKWYERYKKAAKTVQKSEKVECLMEEILKDIHVLACERLIGVATEVEVSEIEEDIKYMNHMPPSLEEENGNVTQNHQGSGNNNANTGSGPMHTGHGDLNYNNIKGDAHFGGRDTQIHKMVMMSGCGIAEYSGSGNPNLSFGPNLRLPIPKAFDGVYTFAGASPVNTYISRPELEQRLVEHLSIDATTDQHEDCMGARTVVLWGLGGAGKSQLAYRYVQKHRQHYHQIFWLAAGQRQSIERDYRAIYRLLHPEAVYSSITVPVEVAITAVKARLQNLERRSLWVMDSADTTEDREDPDYIDLDHYLPDGPRLDRIITTRSSPLQDLSSVDGGIEVADMTEEQAVALFHRHAQLRQITEEAEREIHAIVAELGYLALAVTLAGSYVKEMPHLRNAITMYLPEYLAHRKRILNHPPRPSVHHYNASVLNTWEMSLTAIERKSPFAVRLINLLAVLHYDDIFIGLLELDSRCQLTILEEEGHTRWTDLLSPNAGLKNFMIKEAFSIIVAYSLLFWRAEGQSYSMHKLVHAWCQERLLEVADRQRWSLAGLDLLGECTVASRDDPIVGARLVPHIMANFVALKNSCGMTFNITDLDRLSLQQVAELLGRLGLWGNECVIRTFLRHACELGLGQEHPKTIMSVNFLAVALTKDGQTKAAEKLLRQAWNLSKMVLGEHTYCALASMHNLADVLKEQGKYQESEELGRQALGLIETAVGKQHPATLNSMNNLAIVLFEQGQYSEAEVLYRRISELKIELPLDRLITSNNLAEAISKQGRHRDAEELQQQVFSQIESLLGEQHPFTLTSMSNLAGTLSERGQYRKAEELCRRTLELETKLLGGQHPRTLKSAASLGVVLSKQGQYKEAEKLMRSAFQSSKVILGEQHPNTLSKMFSLAEILRMQEQYPEAEDLHQRSLNMTRIVLGEEHPTTLSNMNGLALTFGNLGKYKEAEELHEHILKISRIALGERHPSTLLSMCNLADILCKQKQYIRAEELYQQVIELQTSLLGEQHPCTVTSMNNFGVLLYKQSRYDEAEQVLQKVVKTRQVVDGKLHPDTLQSMSNLADLFRERDRYVEAELLQREALELLETVLGEQDSRASYSRIRLADVLIQQGQHDEAEKLSRKTLDLYTMVWGKQHTGILESIYHLAGVFNKQAQYGKVEKLYRQLLPLFRKVLGEQHHKTLQVMGSLASVISNQGHHQAAEVLHRQTLELCQTELGEQHPQTLTAMNNLALTCNRQAKYSEAEKMLEQVVNVRKTSVGEQHPQTLVSMNNLGNAVSGQGRYNEAELLHRQTLKLRTIVLGQSHPHTIGSMAKLKEVLGAQGKHEEAESIGREYRQSC